MMRSAAAFDHMDISLYVFVISNLGSRSIFEFAVTANIDVILIILVDIVGTIYTYMYLIYTYWILILDTGYYSYSRYCREYTSTSSSCYIFDR